MNSKARRLADWIADIREAIRNIESDIGQASEEQFLNDGKTLRAVSKSLSDIGEAANQILTLAPHWQQSDPVAWNHLRRTYAMRNVLAHGYFRIDAGVVWATVKQDLPSLRSLLNNLPDAAPEA
jgi:uncharacterized protein with HEPN domain